MYFCVLFSTLFSTPLDKKPYLYTIKRILKETRMRVKNNNKENPKIMERVLDDGRISLYLEYYLGRESVPVLNEQGQPVMYESGKMAGMPKFKIKHNRRKETLNLYLIANPRTPQDRQDNKEAIRLAKKIRQEREQEFLESREGYRLKKDREIGFLDYFQSYIDSYTKKDLKMLQIALNRFKDFLKASPEYRMYERGIKCNQLNKNMMIAFTEYLNSRSKGEGAKSIYQRFKKVVNSAVERDLMRKNPCAGVVIKVDEQI